MAPPHPDSMSANVMTAANRQMQSVNAQNSTSSRDGRLMRLRRVIGKPCAHKQVIQLLDRASYGRKDGLLRRIEMKVPALVALFAVRLDRFPDRNKRGDCTRQVASVGIEDGTHRNARVGGKIVK